MSTRSPGGTLRGKNPRAAFGTPEAVLRRHDLSTAEKIEILEAWEFDERELAVAVEEGMSDREPELLSRILGALGRLEDGEDPAPRAPTKQGGG